MLIDFTVENFKSYRDSKTLSMIASNRLKEEDEIHFFSIPGLDTKILKIAALYGANAAGKSNLIQAIKISSELIHKVPNREDILQYHPFKLSSESLSKPTSFEYRFYSHGTVYEYFFSNDATQIHGEGLYYYNGKRAILIFEREYQESGDSQIRFGRTVPINPKIKALSKVLNRNQLFLSAIQNLDEAEELGDQLSAVLYWFNIQLNIITVGSLPESRVQPLLNQQFSSFASKFLREVDTGIYNLGVQQKKVSKTDFEFQMPIKSVIQGNAKVGVRIGEDWSEVEYDVDLPESAMLNRRRPVTLHRMIGSNKEVAFTFPEESDGTRRLFDLLQALFSLSENGGLYFIDELERSMHPLLAYKIIEHFLADCKSEERQLIFSTHEASLLDLKLNLLLRDEIWFTDKDENGVTDLYPLSDYPVRKDLRVDVGYMQGRFGGIPYIKQIDNELRTKTRTREE